MSFADVSVGLGQIGAQDLYVGMTHEYLEREDVHAVPQAVQSEQAAEVVDRWPFNLRLVGAVAA